jgi:NAD(P)-dependent dehydrogenase (short-subunit alcohol dehydrogenase family)
MRDFASRSRLSVMSGEHNPGAMVVDDAPLLAGSLTNQVAVVTGGSRGIGFAAALGLAKLGANVLIIGQNAANVSKATEELKSNGFQSEGFVCDVSDSDQIDQVGSQILSKFTPTILINSAGVMSEKTAKTLKTSITEWNRVISINLTGVFNSIRVFAPVMVENRLGRIINVTACLGRMSGPGTNGGLAPYRISKAGVNALTKNFAAETGNGKRGVFVDAICPAHCQTDMGGPDAPRTAEQGAETILWLASREVNESTKTGFLWEDRAIVPW